MKMDKHIAKVDLGYRIFLTFITLFLFIGIITENTIAQTRITPSAIIVLPEDENAIVVEKNTQTLFLFNSNANGLELQFKMACSTGEVAGDKKKAGDKKTPEGIYILNNEFEDKYLTPIYGKKAFPTNYPNFMDKRSGKNGSAIWIHGTNKELKPMDSNGCIALENSNIVKLSDYITLYSTPVILLDTIDAADKEIQKTQKTKIIRVVEQWKTSLEKESYDKVLSFYSPDYFPDMNWWEKWMEIRELATGQGHSLKIIHEDLGIYYHKDVFVCIFEEYLSSGTKKVKIGRRELFLENKDTHFSIIGDMFLTLSTSYEPEKAPLIAAANLMIKHYQSKIQ